MPDIVARVGLLTQTELVFLGAVFGSVVLLVLGVAFAFNRPAVDERGRQVTAARDNERKAALRPAGPRGTLNTWLSGLGAKITPAKAEERSAIRWRLVRAGYRSSHASTIYYGSRIALAAGLAVIVVVGAVFVVGAMPTAQLAALSFVASAIGFYLPALWLALRISRRSQDIEDGFPDALDMLLVCVEAGAGMAAAIDRVSRELERPHPVLAEELRLMALEINAGTHRAVAMRRFAARTGVADVNGFVTLLIQSEEFGTSIAESLRVQAREMRHRRLLRAEEKAGKLPVKMAIPLVLIIFPSLMIVILMPVAIRILRAMTVTGG
jgi:tight adherence protein C